MNKTTISVSNPTFVNIANAVKDVLVANRWSSYTTSETHLIDGVNYNINFVELETSRVIRGLPGDFIRYNTSFPFTGFEGFWKPGAKIASNGCVIPKDSNGNYLSNYILYYDNKNFVLVAKTPPYSSIQDNYWYQKSVKTLIFYKGLLFNYPFSFGDYFFYYFHLNAMSNYYNSQSTNRITAGLNNPLDWKVSMLLSFGTGFDSNNIAIVKPKIFTYNNQIIDLFADEDIIYFSSPANILDETAKSFGSYNYDVYKILEVNNFKLYIGIKV